MTCCRCGKKATFDSPRDFCDEHWARWWGGFDVELPFEDGAPPEESMYLMALENLSSREKNDDEA